MEINILTIITIVFSSSLLAALLTFLGNRWLQRNNYKQEYFKKLLEKRLEAYETLEIIIGQLSSLTQLEDGRLSPMICALGQDRFGKFLMLILQAVSKSIWLGDKTGRKLSELNAFLLSEIEYKIDENEDYDRQLIELGAQHRDQIKTFRSELEQLLYEDLKSLHEIDSFVKRVKQYSAGIPLQAKPNSLRKPR